jgi:hypothetical protein
MSRKTSKTPTEVAAELRARADRAEARAAQQEHGQNPILAPLFGAQAKLAKDITVESRKFNGPQSFSNRLTALRLRLAWIEAEQRYHASLNDSMRDAKKQLADAIEAYTKALANGETVTADDVAHAVASASYEGDAAAKARMNDAEARWRGFSNGVTPETETAAS